MTDDTTKATDEARARALLIGLYEHPYQVSRIVKLIQEVRAERDAELQRLTEVATRIMRLCNESSECPFCGIDDGDHEPNQLCSELDAALNPPRKEGK